MLQQRSTPFAKRAERPRLAPPWAIAAVSALVLGLLVVIFPQEALIRRIVASTEDSELATAYLANLLRAEPDNPELRLVLARQQYRLGKLAAAEATLRVALASPQQPVREDAAWLLWQIRVRELDRLDPDAPLRQQALDALRMQLRELAGQRWGETMTLSLAGRALSIGETELGLRLLAELGERRSDSGPALFNRAAVEALGQGQYRAAGALYFAARQRAGSLGERRQAYIAGLRALQQGNLMEEAVSAGERELKDLGDDREALYVLIEVARAANRIDIADKYARRMLRLSLLEPGGGRLGTWGFRLAAAGGDDLAQLPFDDKAYRLGYEVFLNNRKPEDAYRVAAAAVRQVPRDLAWRERLARVAEWTGKPRVALDNWLYLAQRSGRDEYWQSVLRLAPGLFEDEALLAALQHELARAPDNARWQAALVDTYERLGRPLEGLKYLQELQRRSGSPELLEPIAALAERNGELDTALAAWRQRLRGSKPTPAQALRAATLMLEMGLVDEAAALLDRAGSQAPDSDAAYWRLSGELARLQQQDVAALAAYRRLIAGGMGEAGDYLAAVALFRDSEPLTAARIATAGWRRFHRLDLYQSALDLLAGQDRRREFGELLTEPDAAQRVQLQRRPAFLQLRARYHQQRGQTAAARRDLEAALALAPQTPGLRQALLWLAIDGNDAVGLRRTLARYERTWAADPAMHDALAAGWQALSLPQRALDRYLTPHLGAHRGDFLWLMNYADALEQNQENDRAWSLRRALLAEAARRRPAAPGGDGAAARRVARDRLEMLQSGGDARLAALRELLRLDRDAAGKPSPMAREAMLSWYQDAGEYSAERAYLWQQYGRNLARPLWADIASAAATDDGEALAEVLGRGGERLSRYDRVGAALRTGDWRGAQSDAFDTATVQRNDDELQRQLSDVLLQNSDWFTLGAAARKLGNLGEQERSAAAAHVFSPNLRLDMELARIRRAEGNAGELAAVPSGEDAAALRLRIRGGGGETRIGVAARDSLRRYRPVQVERDQGLAGGFSLGAGLGLHLPSAESEAMRVAGMKDQLDLAVHFNLGERERARLQWSDARYFGQTGTELGRGNSWQSELAVPVWLETPDLEVSGFASQYRFSTRRGAADDALQSQVPAASAVAVTDLFVPTGFRFYGLRLSSNMRYQGAAGEYSRILRPYAAASWTRHSELGVGYDLSFGFAGSVIGGDRLTFGYSLSKGGAGVGGHVRELDLSYQQHF